MLQVKKRSGDSWSYSFSSAELIEGTFNLLRNIQYEGGSIPKKTLSTRIRDLTVDKTEPPRMFLEHLELITPVSFNYNITDKGRRVVEMFEKGRDTEFAKEIFTLVKDRYQVARYLDKFIATPGRQSFKQDDFDSFVIREWLFDFGYEKDDRIDRENVLALAEWLGLITWDENCKEYLINREFKPEFSDVEFLAIIRELASFRNEWSTIDFCEKLRARHREYMRDPPDMDFLLHRLIELQKENSSTVEFSPGWPTPPVPPAYAFMRFVSQHIATLRAPANWRELKQVKET